MEDRNEARLRFRLRQLVGGDDGLVSKLVTLIAGPYQKEIEQVVGEHKLTQTEKRAMARKLVQRPDVVVFEELALHEVAEILRLKDSGMSGAKIAALFDLPNATVKTILDTMAGKHRSKVLYNGEMRRRRAKGLQIPDEATPTLTEDERQESVVKVHHT